jgi:hypothetical protein
MPCTDNNGNVWNTNDKICEAGVQKICRADGTWEVPGVLCDGTEKNAVGLAKAGGLGTGD